MGRKIAILGKAPDSIADAPFDDPTWEIWCINDSLYREQIPRAERQFELHPIDWTKEPEYDKYFDWLCQCPIPVYLQAAVPEIANGVVYPLADVIKHFAGPGQDYFTNSISYMIALAIMELDKSEFTWDVARSAAGGKCELNAGDKPAIGLWGVNMAQHGVGAKSEYAAQRPSCEWWLGIAKGRGYTVHLPQQSDLLGSACLYGFDMGGKQWSKYRAREKELKQRIAAAEQTAQNSTYEAYYLRGALEATQYDKQWLHAGSDK